MHMPFSNPQQEGAGSQGKVLVLTAIASRAHTLQRGDVAGGTQWHRLNLPYWIFEANVSPERKKSKNCEDSMTQDTHTPGTASLQWPQSLGLLHTQGPGTSKVAFTG